MDLQFGKAVSKHTDIFVTTLNTESACRSGFYAANSLAAELKAVYICCISLAFRAVKRSRISCNMLKCG